MRKYNFRNLIILVMMFVAALLMVGCNLIGGSDGVMPEEIRVENPHIYLAPDGAPSSGRIVASVYPSNATDPRIVYSMDPLDAEYLIVTNEGNLQAKKIKDTPINVRVSAKADSSVNVIVKITIEVAEVKGIFFTEELKKIELGKPAEKINLVFSPSHASVGRNVEYKVLDEKIAEVDQNGMVTPLAVGITTVEVKTPTNLMGEYISAYFRVEIQYAPLKYQLEATSPTSVFNQMVGRPEEISFSLNPISQLCDQNPQVQWYIDNTHIQGFDGVMQFKYTPKDLPNGAYQIQARLTDKSNRSVTYKSSVIRIYDVLENFDIDIISGANKEYKIGDTLQLEIKIKNGAYPPESYHWFLIDADTNKTIKTESNSSRYFAFKFTKEGNYLLKAEAVIKGANSGIIQQTVILSIGFAVSGNDINNVFVDGIEKNGEYYPIVKWDALPYASNFTVEIKTTDGDRPLTTLYKSDDQYNQQHFVDGGFVLPSNIANLDKDFSVRVKGERFDFTEEVRYQAGTIAQGNRGFLKEIILGYNSYFSSMTEIGQFINYISLFRPAELKQDGDYYKFAAYFPFKYTDLDPNKFPLIGDSTADEPNLVNGFNILTSAFNAYGDTSNLNVQYSVGGGGEMLFGIKFTSNITDELKSTEDLATKELNSIGHYTSASRPQSYDQFPIDGLEEELAVTTSNQLYYATSLGKKPIPTSGSAAETMLTAAKKVLRNIIDDDMNQTQKVHAIYDYLSKEVVYDHNLSGLAGSIPTDEIAKYDGFHLEGVFLRRQAVCDGIAKAFNLMCAIEGIESQKVTGVVGTIGHAWNLVLVDGEYYWADPTWSNLDVGYGREVLTHQYLLLNDKEMASSRKTFGDYPKTASTSLMPYLSDTMITDRDKDCNASIDSVQEMRYILQKYLPSHISSADGLWTELYITDTAMGDNSQTEFMAIVMENVFSGLGIGYEIYNISKDSNYILIYTYKTN